MAREDSIGVLRQRLLVAPEPFAKMSGSGNDFVMIDNRAGLLTDAELPEFARRACQRGVSIGADGVVAIERPVRRVDRQPPEDFRWRYINADGSDADFCGNGAMCGARFALHAGIAPATCVFQTPVGSIHVRVSADDSRVRISMPDSGPLAAPVTLDVLGRSLAIHFVHLGVPHAVAFVDNADSFAGAFLFAEIGKHVRLHSGFAPDGVNVNLAHRIDAHTIRMRTYERGVEAETLACGTGAVASAVVAMQELGFTPPVTIVTSSGRVLEAASHRNAADGCARDSSLSGEARFIATGELHPEGWHDA
jgi:diaminopimelate epimerase